MTIHEKYYRDKKTFFYKLKGGEIEIAEGGECMWSFLPKTSHEPFYLGENSDFKSGKLFKKGEMR